MDDLTATHALAEAWASIDGRLERYFTDRDGKTDYGHWEGYNHEAETMNERLANLWQKHFDRGARFPLTALAASRTASGRIAA